MRIVLVAVFSAVMMGHFCPIGAAEDYYVLLKKKLQDSTWVMRIARQGVAGLQESCNAVASNTALSKKSGKNFQQIFSALQGEKGRKQVIFMECNTTFRFQASAVSMLVIISSTWLERAVEEDMWVAAAHELSHRPEDYFLLVAAQEEKVSAMEIAQLRLKIEKAADLAAVALLQKAGKDPGSLLKLLKNELKENPSLELTERVYALESRISRGL